MADFRQYYGIDLPLEDDDVEDVVRIAALWLHLPTESRIVRKRSPDAAWGDGERLLWAVEFGVRRLAWMLGEDGRKGRNKPKPLETPGQAAEAKLRAQNALSHRSEIDKILGIGAP